MPSRIDILFQKFIDGACTWQEYDELMDLLQQNRHEEKVRSMLSQVYQQTTRSLKSGTFVDTNGYLQKADPAPVIDMEQTHRRRQGWMTWSAAALLLLVAGAWFLFRTDKPQPSKQIIAESSVKKFTQRSEQKYLLLPDSTQVWLNVASTLEYPEAFEGKVREVYLSGEAYFDVKHAEELPFIIHTGNISTRVLGTAFNVKAYPDQNNIVVTVKRGKVQVSKNDKAVATLTKGQQVKIAAATKRFAVLPANEKQVADWTMGRLTFDSLPFADILKDLEKNYNVSIELTERDLDKVVITTSFRRDVGVEKALLILCDIANTRLRKEPGKFILSGK